MKEFNKAVADVVGELCKILLPIKDEYYLGSRKRNSYMHSVKP